MPRSPIETIAARVLAEHLNVVAPLRRIFGAEAQEVTDALEVLVAQEVEHVAAEIARAIAEDKGLREAVAEAIYRTGYWPWPPTVDGTANSASWAYVRAALTANREADR